MPEEFKPGCQRPAIKRPKPLEQDGTPAETGMAGREMEKNMIKVGKPAPEFTAPAFYQGKFANVNLSEYKGRWVLLCFYPGDFTFV